MFIILDLYHRQSLQGSANPSLNRHPNHNPSLPKVAEHVYTSTPVLLSAGRARVAIRVTIQARVSTRLLLSAPILFHQETLPLTQQIRVQ